MRAKRSVSFVLSLGILMCASQGSRAQSIEAAAAVRAEEQARIMMLHAMLELRRQVEHAKAADKKMTILNDKCVDELNFIASFARGEVPTERATQESLAALVSDLSRAVEAMIRSDSRFKSNFLGTVHQEVLLAEGRTWSEILALLDICTEFLELKIPKESAGER